jgi:membrane-bound ClpP family serine protease
MRTIIRYLLFQIPEWILLAVVLWFLTRNTPLNFWPAVWFLAFWIVKDFAIYPYVRRAYENTAKTGSEALIGGKGIAHERIAPEGYIRIHGELWKARTTGEEIARHAVVDVTDARGLLLFVKEEGHFQISRRAARKAIRALNRNHN